MLPRLRHRPVGRRNHQDRAVHLRRSGDHVLRIVGVARAVDVRVVTVRRLILHVRHRDRDSALALFRSIVDRGRNARNDSFGLFFDSTLPDRRRQRRLAVVDVPDRPHVRKCGLLRSNFSLAISVHPQRDVVNLDNRNFSQSFPDARAATILAAVPFLPANNFVGFIRGNLLIMRIVHGKTAAPLRSAPNIGRVAEHIGQRHLHIDNLILTATRVLAFVRAARIQVRDYQAPCNLQALPLPPS